MFQNEYRRFEALNYLLIKLASHYKMKEQFKQFYMTFVKQRTAHIEPIGELFSNLDQCVWGL